MQSWIMFAAGILLMTIVFMRRSIRHYRKKAEQPETSRIEAKVKTSAARDLLHDAPPELLRWQVEMHEIARDLKAELDTKMRSLQVLIRMADEATERLQQTIERTN